MSTPGDYRLHPRRKLIYYLQVLDRDTNQEAGRLADIHIAGMLLIGPRRYAEGTLLNVRVLFDDEFLETIYGRLDARVAVRWCKQDVNPEYFVTGLQFVDITPNQEKLINELIRSIGFKG